MAVEDNKAIIRRHIEAVNKASPTVWDEIMASDFLLNVPGAPPGRDGYKAILAAFWNAFPDLHVTIDDLIAEGDKVVLRYTESGTHQGEFFGIAPTGKQYTKLGIAVYRIADSQIRELWVNEDTLGWMQQLGVMPALPIKRETP